MATTPVDRARVEHARQGLRGMVCTVDHVATGAGLRLLGAGGNAVDAAVGASAVLAVTTQHMCGMGGDLWALVHDGSPVPKTLNASGRAGSGADPAQLRSDGHHTMPFRGDIRSTPIPGCVDGWLTLHGEHGSLPLDDVLGPAIEVAEDGFVVSPQLGAMTAPIAGLDGADDYRVGGRPARHGDVIRRPGIARSLRAISTDGRSAWYEGEFGAGLQRLGDGLFTPSDLAVVQADWVEPTTVDAWGHRLWTVPPNSQGYLSLAGAALAAGLDLPEDPDDPRWAHLLIESAKQAAFDRLDVLHEHADGSTLVGEARLGSRRAAIGADASALTAPTAGGGTIYLCTVDGNGMGVSLMQSNAAGFGVHIAVREVGVFLQNRGVGFSLEEDHPAELAPGRRPPSTLAPALVTGEDGSLRAVLGTMGGDGQPQVVLQLLARLLQAEEAPGRALTAPRFTLTVPDAAGFDTWHRLDELVVALERGSTWVDGLEARGHRVDQRPWGQGLFGHAHLIDVDTSGEGPGSDGPGGGGAGRDGARGRRVFSGVADPRALTGAAAGL